MTLIDDFRFIEPGSLVDRELELVTPAERWVDDLLRTLHHPLTRALAPRDAELTREQLLRFVQDYPLGRQHPNPERGLVPAYHFWLRVRPSRGGPRGVVIAGGVGLRVGHSVNLEMFLGHMGYNVYPPARGRRYAQRAIQLLFPLARRLGLNPLWVTCNPDNHASRKTCEAAGGRLFEIIPLPPEHSLYRKGEREKCRYRFDL